VVPRALRSSLTIIVTLNLFQGDDDGTGAIVQVEAWMLKQVQHDDVGTLAEGANRQTSSG